jgi:hypothetical protein
MFTEIKHRHTKTSSHPFFISSSQVTQNLKIDLVQDLIHDVDENDRIFEVVLENPDGGATLGISECNVSLLPDQDCPIVQFTKSKYQVLENSGSLEVHVLRTRSVKGTSTVRYSTEDTETATAGTDYAPTAGVLTFEDGVSSQTISIPIIDNTDYQKGEYRAFNVLLSHPSRGSKLGTNMAVISIIDDDEPGVFEFSKSSMLIQSGAGATGALSVVRSGGSDGRICVPWIVQPAGGVPVPKEILSQSGQIIFENEQIIKPLELDFTGTNVAETLTLEYVLQQPTGHGQLGPKQTAVVTLLAAEDLGTISFGQPHFDALLSDGVVVLLVTREGDLSNAAFVVCETSDGTAVHGKHYKGGTLSVVFNSGEATKEIPIPLLVDDPAYAGQLNFNATLKTTENGPKIGDVKETQINVTCVPKQEIIPFQTAVIPEVCTLEFADNVKSYKLSQQKFILQVHRDNSSGDCVCNWSASGPDINTLNLSMQSPRDSRKSSISSSASSSSHEEQADNDWGTGQVRCFLNQGFAER